MVVRSPSKDDLMDIEDISKEIEKFYTKIFQENDFPIAFSSLMTANINFLMSQCETLEDMICCRNIFFTLFDASLKKVKIEGPNSSSEE